MTSDRELLELAAKAAGKRGLYRKDTISKEGFYSYLNEIFWNPLTDDGDALRLAVKLGIDFYKACDEGDAMYAGYFIPSKKMQQFAIEPCGNDLYAATRRAIVRAAAEIGRSMK